jgi:hypothetical protein
MNDASLRYLPGQRLEQRGLAKFDELSVRTVKIAVPKLLQIHQGLRIAVAVALGSRSIGGSLHHTGTEYIGAPSQSRRRDCCRVPFSVLRRGRYDGRHCARKKIRHAGVLQSVGHGENQLVGGFILGDSRRHSLQRHHDVRLIEIRCSRFQHLRRRRNP